MPKKLNIKLLFAVFIIGVLPALVNGFPLFFYNDSWEYLANASLKLYTNRSVYYGLLFSPLFKLLSIFELGAWAAIIVNSFFTLLIFAYGITRTNVSLKLRNYIAFCMFLLCSYFSISISYILPDIFLVVGSISIYYLLAFDPTKKETTFLCSLLFVSSIVHLGHFSIFICLIVLSKFLFNVRVKTLALPLLVCGFSVIILLIPNIIMHKRAALSPISSLWPLASLSDTGILEQTIKRECAEDESFSKFCQYTDKQITFTQDLFIWDRTDNALHYAFGNRNLPFASGKYWIDIGKNVSKEMPKLIWNSFKGDPAYFIRIFLGKYLRQIFYPIMNTENEGLRTYGLVTGESRGQLIDLVGQKGILQLSNSIEAEKLFVNNFFYRSFVKFLSYVLMFILIIYSLLPVCSKNRSRAIWFSLGLILISCAQTGIIAAPVERHFFKISWVVPFVFFLSLFEGERKSVQGI